MHSSLKRGSVRCRRLGFYVVLLSVMQLLFYWTNEMRRMRQLLEFAGARVDHPRVDHTTLPWQYNGDYPETRFTPHVTEVISSMNHDTKLMVKRCSIYHVLTVGDQPFSHPNITEHYAPNQQKSHQLWHALLQRVFSRPNRVLPYDVSFGSSGYDYEWEGERSCIGSSSPHGEFIMINFQDIKRMVEADLSDKGFVVDDYKPWEERKTTPIWRGSSWLQERMDTCSNNETYEEIIHLRPRRLLAVDYSIDHPTLLDAKFMASSTSWEAPCWKKNATNGLSRLVNQVDTIPDKKYFSEYQTVLVLGGIGAAFRTARHLRAGQAVILADFEFEEWFPKFMEPWVHYIPLKLDLSDLHDTMLFVRDRPKKVKEIALQGQKFYEKYLSYEANEEHVYEFLYRLSIYRHNTTSAVAES